MSELIVIESPALKAETTKEVKEDPKVETKAENTEEITEEVKEESEEPVDDGTEEESETEEEEKPKRLKGYKGKFLKEKAYREQLEQKLQSLQSAPVKEDGPKDEPKPEDFDSPADYTKAVAKWAVSQERKKADEARLKDEEAKKAQSVKAAHDERLEEFKKTKPDFDKVMGEFIEEYDDFTLSKTLSDLLVSSDLGPAALYELAKNPKELERINSLDSISAAKEFGKLEAKLTKPTTTIKKSSAPPPPKTISGTKTEVKRSLEEILADPTTPFKEFDRAMAELERKRKRA